LRHWSTAVGGSLGCGPPIGPLRVILEQHPAVLEGEVLFFGGFLLVQLPGPAKGVCKRGAGFVQPQYLRIHAAEGRHIVLDQTPLGLQTTLRPHRIRSVLIVVLRNALPKHPSPLLVSHNSILRNVQHISAELLILYPVKVFAFHTRLRRPSLVRHPCGTLLPPSRHETDSQVVEDKKTQARTTQTGDPGGCSGKMAPAPCKDGAVKCRGRDAHSGWREPSGGYSGRSHLYFAVDATVGDNGGDALRAAKVERHLFMTVEGNW
jgi:hypothetical protein